MGEFFSSLWAGLISFFTPCVLPMVPIYLMYLTGTGSIEDVKADWKKTVTRAVAFVVGFTLIFVLMGLGASAIGKTISDNRALIIKIGAVIIILFGIMMLGVVKLPALSGGRNMRDAGNIGQALLMGMAFSVGFSPCISPFLGSVLMMAATTGEMMKGAVLLLAYSLGIGIPFVISSFFVGAIRKFLAKHDRALKLMPKIAGVVVIIFGVLMFMNKLSFLSF